jgi:aspartate/methionine/tyrosine aminotransferase
MPFRSSRSPTSDGLFLFMDKAKAKAKVSGLDIIDLSVGASDLPAPPEALQTVQESIMDPTTHSCNVSLLVP